MKNVRGKHLAFARDLVYEAMGPAELIKKHQVSLSSWKRWRKDPVFQAKVRELQAEFESAITHIKYSSKRRRLEELERLIKTLSDFAPDKVLDVNVGFNAQGGVAKPGEQVVRYAPRQVMVEKSNALEIAKLLAQMKDELEPIKAEISGPGGAPLQVDLLARRQKEAEDVASWEAAQKRLAE
tara:strand:+ start:9978 stop:10523 length:546 start_codon:yes stop_codon:yes gene_type:complete